MADILARLAADLPGRVATSEALRRQHANTLTWIASEPPDAVVWPETAAEVAHIVGLAAATGIPVIAYGSGTSLEGHVNAPSGGLSLDLSRMSRILAVNTDDRDAEVEAGVTRRSLAHHLRDTGLFFSVDPGAEDATLGGMAATRASGTNTVRYGTIRDNVLALEAVLADGSIIRTGSRARKSAAGYDLAHLLIGSEGTLGIITRLWVKLHPVPETIVAGSISFPTVEAACRATIDALAQGLSLARIELLDALQIKALNQHAKLTLPEAPALFVELHGREAALGGEMAELAAIAGEHGGSAIGWRRSEEDRRRLWAARHDAFWAVKSAWPGREALVTDVCVPVSRLADCVAATEADIRASGLIAPIVGHVGDGNFHAIPLVDPADTGERERAFEFAHRLARRALEMDGTCTGEHGIGQGKKALLAAEAGHAVDVMRSLKQALDPKGILNPGKIF